MQLNFEIINDEVGNGNYPDLIHFANTQAQVFYLNEGELYGQPTNKIDYGEWDDVVFQDESNASPDTGMSHFEVKVLPGFGIIGGYKAGNTHKMIIYEFAWEMGQYLNSGSIKQSIDNPISSFTLSLENPDIEDPEHPGNIAMGEERALLSPGAKVIFKFGAGEDEAEYEMGTFYVDRSNFTLLSETGSADGRNIIGKALKDQTLDEKHEYWLDYVSNIIQDVFENANIERDNYLVENSSKQYWFNFTPNTTVFNVLEQVFEILPNWKVRELTDGTIVVGSDSYSAFPSQGNYVFQRNKDIFSRQIVRDDAEVYKRVCVHTENFGIAIYREIQNYEGWNLGANKTMYIRVSSDSKLEEVEAYADEIAERLHNVGKIESFTGPFRPHLQVGDQATIVEENNTNNLGVITEITHSFGKNGFYTNITVDSGGRIGKGLLSDYIKKIAATSSGASTAKGDDDINRNEYINIARLANVEVSSEEWEKYGEWTKEGINDGKYDFNDTTWDGWEPAYSDLQPWVKLIYKRRVVIDKIDMYFGRNADNGARPSFYRIQYWNSSFWVDLLEVTNNTDGYVSHTFTEIQTSQIRIIFSGHLGNDRLFINEIETYGYM